MSKAEAIEAMRQGEKVTHRFFSAGEFIFMKDDKIYDENNYLMNGVRVDFWNDRQGLMWESGWSIFIKKL